MRRLSNVSHDLLFRGNLLQPEREKRVQVRTLWRRPAMRYVLPARSLEVHANRTGLAPQENENSSKNDGRFARKERPLVWIGERHEPSDWIRRQGAMIDLSEKKLTFSQRKNSSVTTRLTRGYGWEAMASSQKFYGRIFRNP